MKILTINEAKTSLGRLIKNVELNHEPIYIKDKKSTAVLIDVEDWKSIQETLYLLSIPGMGESIREGLNTPIDKCSKEIEW